MKLTKGGILHVEESDIFAKDAGKGEPRDVVTVWVHVNMTIQSFLITDFWAALYPTLSKSLKVIITEHEIENPMFGHVDNIQFR